MFIIKGLLIFSPFILYSIKELRLYAPKFKYLTYILSTLSFVIIVSPFSFYGWFFDYLLFCIAATLLFNHFFNKDNMRTIKIIFLMFSLTSFTIYACWNTPFGSRLEEKYTKDGITYRLYETPDMVAANTHYTTEKRTFFIFEWNIKTYNGIPKDLQGPYKHIGHNE